jgi:hypothetical protein
VRFGRERRNTMQDHEVAAAILVQTVITSDERLRRLLKDATQKGEVQQDFEGTARFLAPWYEAMLKMVTSKRV